MSFITISQPMFIPWYGIFEQLKRSDVFVHYDDVQLPTSSSFMTRVQINGANGISWLTLPIDRSAGRHVNLNEARIIENGWREKHLNSLYHAYSKAIFFEEMYSLAKKIILYEDHILAAFTQNSVEMIASYLGLSAQFSRSSAINCSGSKSERLVDICTHFKASEYVTGHGAMAYLDYRLFEKNAITVWYPEYSCMEFEHINKNFTPYVSILDFIAHCGEKTLNLFQTSFLQWKDYLQAHSNEKRGPYAS